MLCAKGKTYIPRRSTIVRLRRVVPAFAVTAQDQKLVLSAAGRLTVQLGELAVETLPLGEVGGAAVAVGVVGLIDQA